MCHFSSIIEACLGSLSACNFGSYLDITVSIAVDLEVAMSSLSSSFAREHHLHLTVAVSGSFASCTASGPVLVYTARGRYTSVFRMSVEPVQGFDIILGHDWCFWILISALIARMDTVGNVGMNGDVDASRVSHYSGVVSSTLEDNIGGMSSVLESQQPMAILGMLMASSDLLLKIMKMIHWSRCRVFFAVMELIQYDSTT
ncbi:hypothetical protein BKA93DRAFT_753691 [Sparassis latifolia]